jgi:hypothetical protein
MAVYRYFIDDRKDFAFKAIAEDCGSFVGDGRAQTRGFRESYSAGDILGASAALTFVTATELDALERGTLTDK